MATTISECTTHSAGGITFLHLKLTVGAADTTAAYTISGAPVLKFMSQPFKTTGSTADILAVYNQSTGAITFSGLSNNDVMRVTVGY